MLQQSSVLTLLSLFAVTTISACGGGSGSPANAATPTPVQVNILTGSPDSPIREGKLTLIVYGDNTQQINNVFEVNGVNSVDIGEFTNSVSVTAAVRQAPAASFFPAAQPVSNEEELLLRSQIDSPLSQMTLRDGKRILNIIMPPVTQNTNNHGSTVDIMLQLAASSALGNGTIRAYLSPNAFHVPGSADNTFIDGSYTQRNKRVYPENTPGNQGFSLVGFAQQTIAPYNWQYGFLDREALEKNRLYTIDIDRQPDFIPVDTSVTLPLPRDLGQTRQSSFISVLGVRDGTPHNLSAHTHLPSDSPFTGIAAGSLRQPESSTPGIFVASAFPVDNYKISSSVSTYTTTSAGVVGNSTSPAIIAANCGSFTDSALLPNQISARVPGIYYEALEVSNDFSRVSWRNATPQQVESQTVTLSNGTAEVYSKWELGLPKESSELIIPALPEALAEEWQSYTAKQLNIRVNATDSERQNTCSITHNYIKG